MKTRVKKAGKNGQEYTGIKMDRRLYELAKGRAQRRHQTYSEYVRQLIVQDVEKTEVMPA